VRIRGIDWAEDDMGFTISGNDGNVSFYDLQILRKTGAKIQDKDFNIKF
jgi:hypothetical protein